MSKNVATAIAEGLGVAGVERLYGLPGGEMLALLEECRKAGIEFILTHHEASAAFMAAAEGQFQRKVSACVSTLGPGATNLTTGIAHAYLDRCPMLSYQLAHRQISGETTHTKGWILRGYLLLLQKEVS